MAKKPQAHQKPNFNNRENLPRDKRLSVCGPCNKGIFEGREDYTYVPARGYVHLLCLESNEVKDAA